MSWSCTRQAWERGNKVEPSRRELPCSLAVSSWHSRTGVEELAIHDLTMRHVIPLGGRLGDAGRDLAPVMVFLASDGARFVTGQAIAVDGGMVMLGERAPLQRSRRLGPWVGGG